MCREACDDVPGGLTPAPTVFPTPSPTFSNIPTSRPTSFPTTPGVSDPGEVANISGSCVAGAQFIVFNESLQFQDAVHFCVGQGSTLARIGNPNEHFRVVDLLVAGNFSLDCWIGKNTLRHQNGVFAKYPVLGLIDPPPNDGNLVGNTERFVLLMATPRIETSSSIHLNFRGMT